MNIMKKIGLILFTSLLIAACNESTENYQPLQEYDYLKDPIALSDAVDNKDRAYVRKHGWNLWAGIMQPANDMDWPIWYTWKNTFDAFPENEKNLLASSSAKGHSLKQLSIINTSSFIRDNLYDSLPKYKIPQQVIDIYKDSSVFTDTTYSNLKIGEHFMSNDDIMIATESLSEEAFDWIINKNYYKKSKLESLYNNGSPKKPLEAPQKYIVTKHMYWPVPQEGISALPVWDPKQFNDTLDVYAGYEMWNELVGIDPTGEYVGLTKDVSFLYNVTKDSIELHKQQKAKVYSLDDFYYHQVTKEEWKEFAPTDKAILNTASYWAHKKPFGPGDYLVTIAMHINTKEIDSWALQSVWWSNKPNKPDKGDYHKDRPSLPDAKGPWYNYLLVDSYGIIDSVTNKLPIAMNPYIELAVHPIATNCNNCHSRAGYPRSTELASYQNEDCLDMLEKFHPNDSCFSKYLLTDFQWLIPDHSVDDLPNSIDDLSKRN